MAESLTPNTPTATSDLLVDEDMLSVSFDLGLIVKPSLPFRITATGDRRCRCRCDDGGKHPDHEAEPITTLNGWAAMASAHKGRWHVLPMVVTGQQPNGTWLLVLDLDSEGAVAWLPTLDLPPTFTVTTGRGVHVYLLLSAEQADRLRVHSGAVSTTALFMHPDIDNKFANSFVVAPGALHPSGLRYTPDGQQIASMPDHLVELLRVGEDDLDTPVNTVEFPAPDAMTLGDVPSHVRALVLRPRSTFGKKPNSRSEGTWAVATWAKRTELTPEHAEAAIRLGGAGLATRLVERKDDIVRAWRKIGGSRPDPRLRDALERYAAAQPGDRRRVGTLALTLAPRFGRYWTVVRSREDMATDMGVSERTAGRARDDMLADGVMERSGYGRGGMASEFRLAPHMLAQYLRMPAPPASALTSDDEIPCVLPDAVRDPLAAYVPDALTNGLQRAVYEAMNDQPQSTNAIAKRLGSKWETIKKHLVELTSKGLAEHQPPDGWVRTDTAAHRVSAFGFALAGGRRIERKLTAQRRQDERATERDLMRRERRSGFERDEWDQLMHDAAEALAPDVRTRRVRKSSDIAIAPMDAGDTGV